MQGEVTRLEEFKDAFELASDPGASAIKFSEMWDETKHTLAIPKASTNTSTRPSMLVRKKFATDGKQLKMYDVVASHSLVCKRVWAGFAQSLHVYCTT